MLRLPPRSTRTDTLCPYTTLFRSTRQALRDPRNKRVGGAATGGDDGARKRPASEHSKLCSGTRPNNPAARGAARLQRIGLTGATTPARSAFRKVFGRTEEQRGGKECVITCRFRWSPYP